MKMMKLRMCLLTAALPAVFFGCQEKVQQPSEPATRPTWSQAGSMQSRPADRIGGVQRDKAPGVKDVSMFFVASRSAGLTTQEKPVIYWYISAPAKEVRFTLLRSDTKQTMLRIVATDVLPGFHKIELSKQQVDALESNDARNIRQVYRMVLTSADTKAVAAASIARVGKSELLTKNDLWFDQIDSLVGQLAKPSAGEPRKQFQNLLASEEVLVSDVSPMAGAQERQNARRDEKRVFEQLSVPDPIDIQSDVWKPTSVPDPVDIQGLVK